MFPIIHLFRAGIIDYKLSLGLQKYFANQYKLSEKLFKNVLILTEHNPVYTIGIRTKNYTDMDENRLKMLGADFYKTNRGGLITFHGPGQLVVYPILNLKHFQPSMRWYISNIEKTVIHVCKQFDLNAITTPDTGIWIEDRKICAIGVHGSRFITTHGLALNCETDLSWFDHIVPCGIEGKGVTSLSQELEQKISVEKVIPTFLDCFKKYFNCEFVEYSDDEKNNIWNCVKENL